MEYTEYASALDYLRDGRKLQKEPCPTCRCWSMAKRDGTDEEPVCINGRCPASPWYLPEQSREGRHLRAVEDPGEG